RQVENAWKNLRPMTKEMLVRVLARSTKPAVKQNFSYDAHSDWELSSLLDALDEKVAVLKVKRSSPKLVEVSHLAEVCASVLEAKTESAEIFIQLAKRALAKHDYVKIDKLSDILFERFSASEVAEVIRQSTVPQIRAIGYETLAVMPTSSIKPLVKDPLYFEIACNTLEQQAVEFENEEAGLVLESMAADFTFNQNF
ncbi:MAG: hypothetical protein KDB79_16305, partial [Acidobacteria bacterium]|nr:hypothetical protein [Acidobacteriota bacterium]